MISPRLYTKLPYAQRGHGTKGADAFVDFVRNHNANAVLCSLDVSLNNIRQKVKEQVREVGLEHGVLIKVNE